MLPTRTPRRLPVARSFDLITPAGQVHRFPEPTGFERAAVWLSRFAEPIILLTVVMSLATAAGFLAEALEPVAASRCMDQISSAPDTPA